MEAHAAERRRALHEVSERLRGRERGLREQLDRRRPSPADAWPPGSWRPSGGSSPSSRDARPGSLASPRTRSAASTPRSRCRARSLRSAFPGAGESIEDFVRQAEAEVSDRIVELARATADRMERRLRDGARAAEAQGEVASERLRHVSERLDAALAAAEQRIAAYEEELDVRLDAKLGDVERAVRAVERD